VNESLSSDGRETMKGGIITIIAGVVLVFLALVVVPMAAFVPMMLSDLETDPQFKVPGKTQIAVDKPGRYYLWNNYRTVFEGRSFNRNPYLPDGMEIRISDAQTGKSLDFVGSSSASANSEASSSRIGYVEIPGPCKVEIEVTGGQEELVFSFSKSDFPQMLRLIVGTFVAVPFLGLAGFGVIIWGIVKLVLAFTKRKTPAQAANPQL
jgi:hypothetical protein